MKRYPRIIFAVLFILITVLSLHIVGAQVQPVFRIGVLDGEQGRITNGARLAVREINDSGGVRGADGTFFLLELIIQPIDEDVTLAEAAELLRQAQVVAVLGPEANTTVLNNIPVLQSLNVPVFTPATGDTILTTDNSGRIFRSRAAEVLQGRALASYIINDLQLQSIATVQLDLDISTSASLVGFSTAASALGRAPNPVLQLQSIDNLPQVVNQLVVANTQIVVAYGKPDNAAELFNGLREGGWEGFFAYNHVDEPDFRDAVPFERLPGILSTTTWPFTGRDEASDLFRDNFIRTFATVPGAVEAASYDAVKLLADAISRPGELQTNLIQLDNVAGVQGLLRPAVLGRGEVSDNVAVVQLGDFGAPEILARFQGNQRVSEEEPIGVVPTPTPAGVVATITRAIQNVRSGPSTSYEVIGQLQQNDQVQVIGANIDFSWLVISFRGQQGWVSTSILDVFGDLNTLPIINPPPTPTPPPSPTAAPTPDIVIDAASGAPIPFIVGQPFNVSVTVRNGGGGPSGQFAIAATFPPSNIFASAIVPPLAAGQTVNVNLTGTFTNTGFYSVVIVADLNNEVAESNETNNLFNFTYSINKPILRQGSQTIVAVAQFDLEGTGNPDISWDGTAITAVGSATVARLDNVTLSTIHYDLLSPSIVNQPAVQRTQMNAGTIIGVITADGNRGVIRVDDMPGNNFVFTFLVYQN